MKEIILNISYVLMVWGVAALLVVIPYICKWWKFKSEEFIRNKLR